MPLMNMRASIIMQFGRKRNRMMSSSTSNREPWLMLPSYGDRSSTKLYSLAEKKVVSIKKETAAPAWAQGRVIHMGCTHGWMASFNMFNRQTFLSNPITGRHIKLPDIHTFLKSPYDPASIILTSSPDAHDCRAIMTSDWSYKPLAVCFPAHTTTNWLPVDLAVCDPKQIVYSTRQSLLFCITWGDGDGDEDKYEGVLECWDLESPSFVWKVPSLIDVDKDDDRQPLYLVMDEHSDRLFLVMRHVLGHVQRDGSHLKSLCTNLGFPHKTISFDVYEIDAKKGKLSYMEGSLDGDGVEVFEKVLNLFPILERYLYHSINGDGEVYTGNQAPNR
ncbi:uncharacterized protein LOC121810350 [Salvia splendens]|uniref:uncharacterized protein LOC121810350 n=1 Tax=Salvia splendens TaxID=180675 RepID=UPI001C272A9E|nr:uncharacterized protein LOC121810350 [Salvia splendens]